MRNRHHFSDELERRYQIKYHMDTYEARQALLAQGAAREDVTVYIQKQMDDIWKEYRAEKEQEYRELRERETFHPLRYNESCPFQAV